VAKVMRWLLGKPILRSRNTVRVSAPLRQWFVYHAGDARGVGWRVVVALGDGQARRRIWDLERCTMTGVAEMGIEMTNETQGKVK
jgi:hypothetical protein